MILLIPPEFWNSVGVISIKDLDNIIRNGKLLHRSNKIRTDVFQQILENLHNPIVFMEDGVYHREDGPAIIYPNGNKEWWFRGVKYSSESELEIISKAETATIKRVRYYFGGGTLRYIQNNKKHREDGPTILTRDGRRYYYLEGEEYPQIKNDVQWLIEVQKIKREKMEDLQI